MTREVPHLIDVEAAVIAFDDSGCRSLGAHETIDLAPSMNDQIGIEFGSAGQAKIVDDAVGDAARHQHLDLAHDLFMVGGRRRGALYVRARRVLVASITICAVAR